MTTRRSAPVSLTIRLSRAVLEGIRQTPSLHVGFVTGSSVRIDRSLGKVVCAGAGYGFVKQADRGPGGVYIPRASAPHPYLERIIHRYTWHSTVRDRWVQNSPCGTNLSLLILECHGGGNELSYRVHDSRCSFKTMRVRGSEAF